MQHEAGSADALIALLEGPDYWILNRPIVRALGLTDTRGNCSISGHWPNLVEFLGNETKLIEREQLFAATGCNSKQGRPVRAYSKIAVIMIGLRAQTPNARAFHRWCATRLVEAQGLIATDARDAVSAQLREAAHREVDRIFG